MKNVFFGLGLRYDSGDGPCIAINNTGRVVEVHKNEFGLTLYSRSGRTDQMTVKWDGNASQYTTGVSPAVAINNANRVVEVHKNEAGVTLYAMVGTLGATKVTWQASREYTSGITPSVALNDAGKIVEVHRSEKTTRLYYRFGKLGSTSIDWKWDDNYDNGETPRVAINNSDQVVEVHRSEGLSTALWYHVGRIDEVNKKISFGSSHQFGSGANPSVALTDEGDIIVVYAEGGKLMQRFGRINMGSKTIDWTGEAKEYDSGVTPSVAATNGMAIEAHEGEIKKSLWFATSKIMDRAWWMTQMRSTIGTRKIPQLVLPASHDSAMYLYSISLLGKTQYLSIYDQLEYGIRYYDLRPKWTGSKFVIYHGPIPGPDLSVVLADIRRYCQHGHKELVVISWSHFEGFTNDIYKRFTNEVDAAIGQWQYKGPLAAGQRLADIPLNTFTATGPSIISAVDKMWPVDNPKAGFWVFREWDASDSNRGDLVVFDKYSDTTDYERMKADQLLKFATFTGKQKNFPALPVDIFLFSWTLTPITGVWLTSKDANRHLGDVIADTQIPNGYGRIMNALYVDYVEYARVTDVGVVQNQVQVPASRAKTKAPVKAAEKLPIRKPAVAAKAAAKPAAKAAAKKKPAVKAKAPARRPAR